MMKNEIINKILLGMSAELNAQQLQKLKACMNRVLYSYSVQEVHTDVACLSSDENTKYLQLFQIEMRIEGLSDGTINHYVSETSKMLSYIGKSFRNITKEDITYYLAYLSCSRNLSPTTLDNTRKYIKAFFNWAVYNDHLLKNPFNKVKCIKREPVKKEILSEHEIELLRDACVDERELALVDFLNSTGVRVSEAAAAKIDDIDFSTGKCQIYAKKTKTWRTVFLDAKALKHLSDYRQKLNQKGQYPDFVFASEKIANKGLSEDALQKILKHVKKRAGLSKNISIHTFRKTFASRLYKKGLAPMSIALLLGHKDFSTTAKYYIQIDGDILKYEYDKVC